MDGVELIEEDKNDRWKKDHINLAGTNGFDFLVRFLSLSNNPFIFE